VSLGHQLAERGSPLEGVCVFHDVERGRGHLDVDPEFAQRAERDASRHLDAMLAIEAELGVDATYNVLGCLLDELRERLRPTRHALGFHSFDHATGDSAAAQVARCREVDARVRGYRPPRSLTTDDLHGALREHGFEWLASSARSLGADVPTAVDGIAHIPVHLDDFSLHTGSMSYPEWERRALDLARERPFAAIGLHDCYAPHWLPHYRAFLEKLSGLRPLRTFDGVADEVARRTAA
jgi:peptidoglycan/xylan/chitin deacetylase (PgdA/CDA1 family)